MPADALTTFEGFHQHLRRHKGVDRQGKAYAAVIAEIEVELK